MKKAIGAGLFALAALVLTSSLGLAAGWGTTGETLKGTVLSVGEDILTIQDQAAADSMISEVDFKVTEETRYEEIEALSELQEGDQVEIEYKQEGEEKIALRVEKVGAEGEMRPQSDTPQQPEGI